MGMMSISYPARTAFFCSSIFIFCRSLIFRLILRIAVGLVDRLDMQVDRHRVVQVQKLGQHPVRQLRRQDLQEGDMAPEYSPMRKVLPSFEKVKLVGAIKSFVERPVFGKVAPGKL